MTDYRNAYSTNRDDSANNETLAELGTTGTENLVVAGLALRAADPIQLEPGGYYVVHNGKGGVKEYDLTGDAWRDTPKRITDRVTVTHLDTLHAYWDKYADEHSEMWADPAKRTLTAIIDAHGPGTGGSGCVADWQSHRATLQLVLSDPLKAWLANNDKLMTQDTFGEFVEEQIPYIAAPPAADLQEMIHDLEVTQSAEFRSGVRLKTGARRLHWAENIDGKTKDGTLDIPDRLVLHLPIWQGDDDQAELTARFRFRVNQPRQGQVSLLYKLDGVNDLIQGAFTAAVGTVAAHIGRPVFYGTPAS